VIGIVVEFEGLVVGYMIYELLPEAIRIQRIVVTATERRQGFGTALIRKIVKKLRKGQRTSISVSVSDDDFETVGFFKSLGFGITKLSGRLFDLQFSIENRLKVNLKNRIKSGG
jgi:ribosomal protein S18 acetylase RimI-like enzyme